jgi:hypothetical protein
MGVKGCEHKSSPPIFKFIQLANGGTDSLIIDEQSLIVMRRIVGVINDS